MASSEFEVNEEEEEEQGDIFVKKIVKESREPNFQIVPGTSQSVQLLIYATVDYSDYLCDVDVIDFDDTLMFEVRTFINNNTLCFSII